MIIVIGVKSYKTYHHEGEFLFNSHVNKFILPNSQK